MTTKSVSVLVVEDSAVARELITDTLNSDPRIDVVCAVDSAEKALKMIPSLAPKVISMDIRLPGIDGIEATRRIMEQFPTPIVIVASDLSRDTVDSSMEAIRAGALAVMQKPTVDSLDAYKAMARRLCDQFVNLSEVKVVRQRFNNPPARHRRDLPIAQPTSMVASGEVEIVGIVASTGGPPAIANILQGLGANFPLPVLIVQHMGAAFLDGYAKWLDSVCDLKVVTATEGVAPLPGHAYVGPGGFHLTHEAGRIRLIRDLADRGHIPSGDMLFGSLATGVGARGIGVLLTGMGDDGARGLLAMRNAGAYTIGQDRQTSAVYGMPAVAMSLGAVREELPIGTIAARVLRLVTTASAKQAAPPVSPAGLTRTVVR